MSKRGALNLGISTVVVLVIAMVVIGAGVSFIRTFFTAGTDSLIGAFDGVGDLGMTPDRNNLFVVDRETVTGSATGDLIILRAAIYNPTTTTWEEVDFKKNIECSGFDQEGQEIITIESVEQDIPPGTYAGYQVGIRIAEEGAEQKMYICMLELEAKNTNQAINNLLPTKQITIDLR